MSTPPASLFGLSFGPSYALAAFTLTLAGCLPLAWLLTLHVSQAMGADLRQSLVMWLLVMAASIAIGCAALYGKVRNRTDLHRHVLMGMWLLSALGMAGWWTV